LRTDVKEAEVRKHIRQAVIDEGACQRPPVHRVELVDSFRRFRVAISDKMCFVQNDAVPPDSEEQPCVFSMRPVGSRLAWSRRSRITSIAWRINKGKCSPFFLSG
jgi:hypothetical protein